MDPITLITTAAIVGAATISKKLVERSTEHVWDRFIGRLRDKAQNNEEAIVALSSVEDPIAVHKAITAIGAVSDPEVVQEADLLMSLLPQEKHTKEYILQIAKIIQNIEKVEQMNISL